MEFTLTYRGKLLGASRTNTRADEKQRLRELFSRQLERIWKEDIRFNDIEPLTLQQPVVADGRLDVSRPIQDWKNFFFRYPLKGYTFVPLVTGPLEADCQLGIRLHRPQRAGDIVATGGDLDNKLKTLFDALRIPREPQEVPNPGPGSELGLVYCLLADDRLVTKLSIDSRRLLDAESFEPEYVEMTIDVTIHAVTAMGGTLPLLW